MADYGEISTIIGEMKRAAIDSFMANQGWFVDYEYSDRYALWGFIPSWYRRPEENGEGGGERIAVGSDSLVEGFNNIRSRIDGATSKWVGLPTGAGASDGQESANSVATEFGAAASGGSAIADGEVEKSIDTISNTVVSNVRGSFKAPFLDKYDAQFAKVVGGLGAASALLQTAYAAEGAIWPAARQDAVDICDSARNAFRLNAKQSAEEVRDFAFGVIGAVAGVVTTVASAGTAAPIVTLLNLAKNASDAVGKLDAAANIATDSYDSIIESLESASRSLDEVVTEQEGAVRDMTESAGEVISTENESFNLDAYALRTFPTDNTISLDRSEADTVVLNMDRLITAMSSATTAVSSIPGDAFLRRDPGVGLGATGPYAQISRLHELVSQSLTSTRNEYERGRDLFQAVVDDYFATEGEAEAIAQALLRELETETLGS